MDRRAVTVFGASGFIGRHLVQRLTEDGWIVRAAVRDVEAAGFLRMFGQTGQVVPMSADVADRASVEPVVDGVQAVVNLVGILYQRGRTTFRRVHVDGAANVAAAARAAGVERLVQMSAIGADPDSEAEYGRTKWEGEQAARQTFEGVAITRPSVVFGPEDDFFNRFATLARFLPVLPVFPTRFQPVWVGDVADAIARILGNPETAGKTYELGGPQVITFRRFLEIVLRETGRKRLLVELPLAVAEVQALFLEWLPVPPLTRDQVKLLGRDNVVSASALTLRDLGIQPTAIEAIVPAYLARYRPQSARVRR